MKNIGTRENEKTIARNLYRVLREFDEEDVEEIYSESFAAQGIGKAIMNRLEKSGGAYASFGGGDRKTAEVPKNHIYKRYGFCPGADGGGDVKA